MEVVMQHLQRDKKSQVLIYRRRFPLDLVGYIESKSPTGRGRMELKVSLRSTNINEPGARSRYAEAEAEFEAIVAKARRVADQAFDRLDEALVQYLADTYLHDQLEADESMRWKRAQKPPRYVSRGDQVELYLDCREMLEDYDTEGLVAYWKDWAMSFAEAIGFLIDPKDKQLPVLCRALGEAACRVWLSVDQRIDGVATETPQAPPVPEVPTGDPKKSEKASRGAVSLMGLYDKYAAVPGRHAKTIAQWRPYIQHLVGFVGADDVRKIDHDALVRWRNHLRDEVKYRGKPLSAKTINGSYLGAANALFAWAKGDGHIASNPMLEVSKVKLPKKARTRSKGFTSEEALSILRATLQVPTSREKEELRNAKRWCPWLMAYSGARVNEITQLRKEDVFQQDGVWVMRITPDAGTVKTKEPRLVPLHSHLKEQGFLRFVQGRPEGPLFYDPEKRRSDNAINRQANRLGSKLASWVRSLGIEGVMPNHAWRHYFISQAVRYRFNPAVTRALTGHAAADVHGDYEHIGDFVDVLSREIELIPRFEVGG